jgi:hypothetical protein
MSILAMMIKNIGKDTGGQVGGGDVTEVHDTDIPEKKTPHHSPVSSQQPF